MQQNANEVFKRMLVSWIGGAPEVPENDVSFKFLHELKGFDFIISRLSNNHNSSNSVEPPTPEFKFSGIEPFSPQFMSRENSKLKSPDKLMMVSDDEASSDNSEGAANMLKFVGNKLGVSLVKATS